MIKELLQHCGKTMLWKLFCDPTHDIVEILVVVDGDLQKAGAIGMRLYRWADYFAR